MKFMNAYIKIIIAVILCGLYMSVMAGNTFIVKYKLSEYQRSLLSDNKINGAIEEQIISKLVESLSNEQLAALSAAAQAQVRDWYPLGTGAHVITLDKNLDKEQTTKFINNVEQFNDIEYIEEDMVAKIT
jgi:hypothetical protein